MAKTFRDSIHGFTANSKSPQGAWMLIRNKCHELKLEVPTMDKIYEIDEDSDTCKTCKHFLKPSACTSEDWSHPYTNPDMKCCEYYQH